MSKTLEMNFASSQSTIISHPMKRRRNLSLNHEWPQHFFCAKGDRARERGSLFFFCIREDALKTVVRYRVQLMHPIHHINIKNETPRVKTGHTYSGRA